MKLYLSLSLYPENYPTPCHSVHARIEDKLLDASDDADNEENAVRLTEQTVREAFRRLREKKAKFGLK